MNATDKARPAPRQPIALRPVEGPSVWRSADWRTDMSWQMRLSAEHIADIDRALARVRQSGTAFATITQAQFPLPSMRPLLAELSHALLAGRGFALLKGLPMERYSVADAERIFWGIGTHIGYGVTQNAAADFISHVYDRGLNYGDRTVRAYQVRDALSMHCDNSDLVGLLCVHPAKSGGASLLTSSMSVFNEILRTRPEYMGIYFSGFPYDRKGEQGAGEALYTQKIPVFSQSNGVVSCRYARSYIQHAPAITGVELAPMELDALDYFDAVAGSEEFQFEMQMEPGDMQFCNNYVVLHARRGFENHPEPERGRLLLRLWLEVPQVRDLASDMVRHGFHHFGNLGQRAEQWFSHAGTGAPLQ